MIICSQRLLWEEDWPKVQKNSSFCEILFKSGKSLGAEGFPLKIENSLAEGLRLETKDLKIKSYHLDSTFYGQTYHANIIVSEPQNQSTKHCYRQKLFTLLHQQDLTINHQSVN